MPALLILLIALLGGASYDDLAQHKAVKAAHQDANAAQATVTQLKTAEQAQSAAQAKEDADRAAAAADKEKQRQIQGTYIVATGSSLKQSPPAVTQALQFNDLALSAGDPLLPTTTALGDAMAAATASAQAQQIADLQAQLHEVKADDAQKTQALAGDVAEKISATGQIATLTGTVSNQVAAIQTVTAAKNDALSSFGILSARYGRLIFWVAILGGLVFVAAHLSLFAHLKALGALKESQAAHEVTKGLLTASQAAHAATAQALQELHSRVATAALPVTTLVKDLPKL
jgi:hypothetical protein